MNKKTTNVKKIIENIAFVVILGILIINGIMLIVDGAQDFFDSFLSSTSEATSYENYDNLPEAQESEEYYDESTQTLHLKDATYEITNIAKAEPGEIKHKDYPQILIFYKYTNLSNEPKREHLDEKIKITQETDAAFERLSYGYMTSFDNMYGKLIEAKKYEVKQDRSTETMTSYQIKYPDKPVIIEFYSEGECLGREEIN